MFGSRASVVLPSTGLSEPSRFSFKLDDAEHALDIVVSAGRTAIPGRLGRRMIVHDAEQRLIAMTDRHAGRLRSDLFSRVSAAARGYARELTEAVEAAIVAINDAIKRAGEQQHAGAARAGRRLGELSLAEARCARLAVAVQSLNAGNADEADPPPVSGQPPS